jgi:phosphonopyruvate decarboxylase
VVFAIGDAASIVGRPNHFRLPDPPGYASSIGIGIALHTADTTIVVDDPDSLLANLAALATAGTLGDLPLVHIVLDDTPPHHHVDLRALATALGYRRTYTVEHTEKLAAVVRREIAHCPSPVFVRCPLTDSTPPALVSIGHRTWDAEAA